jgi:hypothetical protein
MVSFILLWWVACCASVVSVVVPGPRRGASPHQSGSPYRWHQAVPSDENESSGIIWLSAIAVAPGLLLLSEVNYQLVAVHLGKRAAFVPSSMVTLVPVCVLLFIGGGFLVASAYVLPVGSAQKGLEFARLIHLVAWSLSVAAAFLSIISV